MLVVVVQVGRGSDLAVSSLLSALCSPLAPWVGSPGGAPPPGLGSGSPCSCKVAPPLPGWWAALGAPGPLVLLPGAPLLGGAAGGGASLPPLCLVPMFRYHADRLSGWGHFGSRSIRLEALLVCARAKAIPTLRLGPCLTQAKL